MNQDFRIGCRRKDRTGMFEIITDFLSVDQVAVMRNGDTATRIIDHDRLDILEVAAAGRRVTDMTNRVAPRQAIEDRIALEDIGNEPHIAIGVKVLTISRNNATALLTAVLQSIKTQIGQIGGFRMAKNTENTTFILKLVKHMG